MATNKIIDYHKSLSLEEWFGTDEYKRGKELSPKEFVEVWFNRMPIRRCYIKPEWIYAPFDGIVTHIGLYDPDKDVFDVKGKGYTINELLETEMNCKCYACGIFLTAFSCHLGRFPINGRIFKVYNLSPITTENLSMILAEHSLLSKKIVPENFVFSKLNERHVIEILDFHNKSDVIIVSIADREVNSILNFCVDGDAVRQGQRMQFVTWGSYAVIIIPKREHFTLEPTVKPFDYVYAGKTVIFTYNKSDPRK